MTWYAHPPGLQSCTFRSCMSPRSRSSAYTSERIGPSSSIHALTTAYRPPRSAISTQSHQIFLKFILPISVRLFSQYFSGVLNDFCVNATATRIQSRLSVPCATKRMRPSWLLVAAADATVGTPRMRNCVAQMRVVTARISDRRLLWHGSTFGLVHNNPHSSCRSAHS
jgi:hypothetical protein